MLYDFSFRTNENAAWVLVHRDQVAKEDLPALMSGQVVKTKAGHWRALPRLPTGPEIVAAANALAQEIDKARRNGDWTHPATMLLIELAHDRFRSLLADGIPPALPSIVSDPTLRQRWRPRRCF